jgi:hypothetical protein
MSASIGCAAWPLPRHWPTIISGGTKDISLPSVGRPFRLSLPTDYKQGQSAPALLMHFHGWGGTLESGQMFHDHGVKNGCGPPRFEPELARSGFSH